MNQMKRQFLMAGALVAGISVSANAQANMAPEFINPMPGTDIVITDMSPNGKWMISETASTNDGDIRPKGGVLINLENITDKYTISHSSGLAGVGGVTDDGSIVVGECQTKPAIWSKATQEWTMLPLPEGYTTGRLNAVTPDGHYAVGIVGQDNIYEFNAVCYDLTTKTIVELPNLPHIDMTNEDQKQNSLNAISPDGRYILGVLSYSYISPMATCTYVYDRQTSTHKFIGFNEPSTPGGKWVGKVDGIHAVEGGFMSPNGEWVGGAAYMVKDIDGNSFGREYWVGYRYNIAQDKFEVYDGQYDTDVSGFSITNDGTLLAATPAVNPYSSMLVRSGNYYYNLSQILKQVYDIDFEAKTGYSVTGKPVEVSADGLTIAMLPSTAETYILRLKEPLTSVCSQIDLLGDYTVTPKQESVFSALTTLSINFGQPVSVVGNQNRIVLLDESGKTVRNALKASAEASTITIGFRTTTLEPGKKYTVRIPAGMICLQGDEQVKSREINITYQGRANGPVKAISAYPADGHAFARLDMSTNPLMVTFDAELKAAENAKGYFYRTDNDEPELICELNIACGSNQMMAYPTAGQYLYKDLGYRIVIPAESVTDLSGQGGNDELVFNYTGTYVREIPTDTRYIFNEDGNITSNWMFHEGDHNQPIQKMIDWGFANGDGYPWFAVRDQESSDNWALVSHSMYSPAGQSDDWMCTTQLFLPDEKCVLTFDSQSYLKSKKDYLKVYLLATDDIFTSINETTAARFRKDGDVIYNELQSPGENEELLAGEWKHNVIDLAKYAGKNVYIAFVNENNDQSAVFVDNVTVVRDVKYAASFENPTRVINKDALNVKGAIAITSELDTYSSISLTLKDGQGNTLDQISETGLNLKNKDVYPFNFAKELPLAKGVENKFSVDLKLGDEDVETLASSVKNLTFEPQQSIVLEEFTGQGCPNCPRGIVAIDNLHRIYGDKFIPIALHCYAGDELGAGLHAYASFLSLNGAPSGRINRGDITSPMLVVDGNYRFSAGETGDNAENLSWLDMAQREFEKQADAQISIVSAYDEDSKGFTVDCTVKSALSMTGQNINLFAVVTEDNVLTYQSNNNHTYENPDLGEWGKGGKYGQSTVYPYYASHVARNAYGTTYNGTGGYIPQNIESDKEYKATITGVLPSTVNVPDNCHMVVMMIDGNTNRIINADQVSLTGRSGVESVKTENTDITVTAVPSAVHVIATGDFVAEIYSLTGRLIASGSGNDMMELPTNGFQGPAIIRVTSGNASSVVKMILK